MSKIEMRRFWGKIETTRKFVCNEKVSGKVQGNFLERSGHT
jgi:hypothetical protein